MANINWKVRLKNPSFWVGIISAIGVFAVSIFALVGIDISGDVNNMVESISAAVIALFSVGAAFGVVVDPTTQGVSDSKQAMTYTVPKSKYANSGCETSQPNADKVTYSGDAASEIEE